ncbi:MAG: NADP(H)-dependent aldo-keto reductase [Sphingomonas bacterium]|jgi:aryl-alcohol dehydrogenase-like predicted oxidoreductase|nr:NADP(H)-dependent aldo-keto reductase [Sphingomonas bacterium]
MHVRKLSGTDIAVSALCLGTMTWGSQNSEAEGHAQIDHALDRGINFLDAAEMYPVTPSRVETRGRTEEIIGSWFARNGRRDEIVLATKIVGPSRGGEPFRGMPNRLDARNIAQAVEDSLRRLQTDYIDLYQLHWPDRDVPMFGNRGLSTLDDHPDTVPIAETLAALGDLVKAGKIRHVGVSNETPWGIGEYLRVAHQTGLPRIVSIQNAYNLLNRVFETGLAEVALRENVGLLAYSPLAAGNLTGKYLDGAIPAGSRRAVAQQFVRYDTPGQPEASARYVALAREHGLDPAQMALAYVTSRAFVTSAIIGATSIEQLRNNIDSIDLTLDDAVVAGIEAIHRMLPDPCP